MKRATITIPDDLASAVEDVQALEIPPALAAVIHTSLREFLAVRGHFHSRTTLRIQSAKQGSGRHDVSQSHDAYLAGR